MNVTSRRAGVEMATALAASTFIAAVAYDEVGKRRRSRIHWRPPSGTAWSGSLHARLVGDTGPPIVLLHGMAGSRRYWGAAYDVLGRHGRLIVPDLLGFGSSLGRRRGMDRTSTRMRSRPVSSRPVWTSRR